MALRTWGRLLLTALGVSLLAGAGQLGIAYGFGIVGFARVFTAGTVDQWPAQLTWVAWFAAVAAVVGAYVADRLARHDALPVGPPVRAAIAGASALGAAVVAPLCMQPARSAEVTSTDPVGAVAVAVLLGALAGLFAAFVVLHWPASRVNVAVVVGALWALALFSVAPSLGPEDPLPAVRLGVPDSAWLAAGTAQRLAVLVLPGLALVAGALAGALARWRGQPPPVGAAVGLAGPAMVAVAYLVAGAGGATDRWQAAPFWASLIAVAAGALGSAAATVVPWPLLSRDPARGGTDPGAAIEPTDILRPLPAGTGLPPSRSGRHDDAASEPDGALDAPAARTPATDRFAATAAAGAAAATGAPPGPTDAAAPGVGPAEPTAGHAPAGTALPFPVPEPAPAPAAVPFPERQPTAPGELQTPRASSPTAPDDDLRTRPPVSSPDGGLRTGVTGNAGVAEPSGPSGPAADPATVDGAERGTGSVTGGGAHRRNRPIAWPEAETRPAQVDPLTWPDPAGTGNTAASGSGSAAASGSAADATEGGDQRPVRRGLFRRNRKRDAADRADTARKGRGHDEPEMPAHDAEYVDWVTGLGKPPADDRPAPESPRRFLRSGRHHRD